MYSLWKISLKLSLLFQTTHAALHWRHDDHDGASNHQAHGCLFNCLFGRWSKKTSKLRVAGLCAGNSPGPVNSAHKGPVTQKMFPFGDVIMRLFREDSLLSYYYDQCHVWQDVICVTLSHITLKRKAIPGMLGTKLPPNHYLRRFEVSHVWICRSRMTSVCVSEMGHDWPIWHQLGTLMLNGNWMFAFWKISHNGPKLMPLTIADLKHYRKVFDGN